MFRSRILLLFLCVFGLPVTATLAAPKASDEILAALQVRLENGKGCDDLIEQLNELDAKELNKLLKDYDQVWPNLRDKYLSDFKAEAKSQNTGTNRQQNKKIIREMREQFHAVRAMPEGPMKEALKTKSTPALAKLRELLQPSAERILDLAGDDLKKQRTLVMSLAAFRDGILKAAIAPEYPETLKTLKASEVASVEEFSDLDRNGLRIMEKNRKIAESAEVPEKERRGVQDLNLMRLLVGQNALEIDPKLCNASRGHSADMARLRFFDHTSPVPGKRTPSDRARAAGTSGGGENIYMGSTDPLAANRGWFYSPGHHKNMFSPGYRRVGLGNEGRHWTQMFGR